MSDVIIYKQYDNYNLDAHGLKVNIKITDVPGEFVPIYQVIFPRAR